MVVDHGVRAVSRMTGLEPAISFERRFYRVYNRLWRKKSQRGQVLPSAKCFNAAESSEPTQEYQSNVYRTYDRHLQAHTVRLPMNEKVNSTNVNNSADLGCCE